VASLRASADARSPSESALVRDSSPAHRTNLRCEHCGRAVAETTHTRSDYRVDYYSLATGDVEPCTLTSEDGQYRITFQKLIRPFEMVTCVDCYRDPGVRRDRERRFRPEGEEQGALP
jgi:hypothetical protein